MPLWLSEDDVGSLVTPGEAVPVIEDCFRRMAAGEVELMPRRRFPVDGGYFAVMAAADRGLEASVLTAFLSGFRQGFSGKIKPDRADLVDGGRIDAAQVAGNADRFLLVGAIQHI